MTYDNWKATNPADNELGSTHKQSIRTSYTCPSIPIRSHDWSAVYDSYEGGNPIGHGATEQEAIADLLEQTEGE